MTDSFVLPHAPRKVAGPTSLPGATAAVVNNTDDIRRFLTEALEKVGVSVLPYERADALLRDPRLHGFRIIVADWANAPLNGRALWDELQQRRYAGSVVFVSPHAEEITEAFRGADPAPADIIATPAQMSKVAARIASHLSGSALGPRYPL